MGDKTGIEWTDATWNPVVGCSKVSPGCDNCYAIGQAERIVRMGGKGGAKYEGTVEPGSGKWTGLVKTSPDTLDQPSRWKRPRRIFVNSMSDLFHPNVPIEFIADVFVEMAVNPRHQFQILTKRPQRMADVLGMGTFESLVYSNWFRRTGSSTAVGPPWRWPLPNVWLGTSIESNHYAFRADHLRNTPAAVRWISAEPLLGPLDDLDLESIDWVVAGGESGPEARPMKADWVRDLRDHVLDLSCAGCGDRRGDRQVAEDPTTGPCDWCDGEPIGTAFLFKQWGNWAPDGHPDKLKRFGRKADAGRELDGRTWDEYPDAAAPIPASEQP